MEIIENIEEELAIYFIENNRHSIVRLPRKKIIEEEDEIENKIKNSSRTETEKQQLCKSRRGQGKFKSNLIKIENSCRVTGVNKDTFLIASHIKPWRFSTDSERLDGNNGLLLSPHVDKLFDRFYISFTDEGRIIRGDDPDVDQIMKKWGLDPDMFVGEFNQKQKEYLAFHRGQIFKSKK